MVGAYYPGQAYPAQAGLESLAGVVALDLDRATALSAMPRRRSQVKTPPRESESRMPRRTSQVD